MPATTEELQARLDALNEAITSGVRKVKYSTPTGSRELEYGSMDDMLRARDLLLQQLGKTSGRTSVRMSADKGLG